MFFLAWPGVLADAHDNGMCGGCHERARGDDLDLPIPSPALFDKIGQKFRRAVASFAEDNHVPWVRFRKEDRKADVMRPYLDRQAATGRSGVAAIGVAQEF